MCATIHLYEATSFASLRSAPSPNGEATSFASLRSAPSPKGKASSLGCFPGVRTPRGNAFGHFPTPHSSLLTPHSKLYPREWTRALARQTMTSPFSGQYSWPTKGWKSAKPQAVDIPGTAGKFQRNPERWTHSFSIGFPGNPWPWTFQCRFVSGIIVFDRSGPKG